MEAQLHRSVGQICTPFVDVAGDAAALSINERRRRLQLSSPPGDSTEFRAMPTVGLEYRYPFISVHSWGTQTIEPIAQVIVRPNETQHRQAAERRFAKPDLRRQQPVQDRQVRRLGPHRRRRPRQRRRAIHRAVQSRRLRQRAVRPVLSAVRQQLVRHRRQHQHRPRQRPRHQARPTMWRACPISRTASTPSPPASASTRTTSRSAGSRPKAAPASTAGRFRRSTATTTPSRSSAS